MDKIERHRNLSNKCEHSESEAVHVMTNPMDIGNARGLKKAFQVNPCLESEHPDAATLSSCLASVTVALLMLNDAPNFPS